MAIILGIIAVVALIAYISALIHTPLLFIFPLAMLVISVIAVAILFFLNKTKLTSEQDAWIAEGIRMDEDNKKKNEMAAKEAKQKLIAKQNDDLLHYRNELAKERARLSLYQSKLKLIDVLAAQDMNLDTVKFVVKQIETRRANSVTEALHQYDEHSRREAKLRSDMFMAEMQRQQEADRRLREAEDHMRQTFHNLEMQKQARRAVSELEEINQKLQDLEDGR